MSFLASMFVGKPLNIVVVAVLLLLTDRLLQVRAATVGGRVRGPRFAGVCWLVYAAWEWLVRSASPEADIRVDLLLIWPLLGVVTLWGLFSTVRGVLAHDRSYSGET